MKDYYAVLGIHESAKHTEIRKAYRKLALELHPDVNLSSSAKEDFLEVNEAYGVLKNVQSRKRYDKLYRIYVLKQEARNQNRFDRNRHSWSQSQTNRANAGRKRGEEDSKKNPKKFKKKQSFWGALDIFFRILDLFTSFG